MDCSRAHTFMHSGAVTFWFGPFQESPFVVDGHWSLVVGAKG